VGVGCDLHDTGPERERESAREVDIRVLFQPPIEWLKLNTF
jgi:hypothetical protein